MVSLPRLSPFFVFLFLSGVMVVRYFLVAGAMSTFCRVMDLRPIEESGAGPLQKKKDITHSLLSSLVFAAIGTLVIELWHGGWTKIIVHQDDPLWYEPLRFLAYAFIQDSYFYWTHRYFHFKGLRSYHRPHHLSKTPTAWTSFAFHPYEALIQALPLPILICLIPIHWLTFALFLLFMSVLGVLNHLGHELYPRFLEKKLLLISATHHQKHHSQMNHNFGLYFTFWDRLMGTELNRHE